MKLLVGAFNQIVGAFSVIVKLRWLIVCSTTRWLDLCSQSHSRAPLSTWPLHPEPGQETDNGFQISWNYIQREGAGSSGQVSRWEYAADWGTFRLLLPFNWLFYAQQWNNCTKAGLKMINIMKGVHCDCINCYKNICSYVALNCTILTSMDL